MDILDIRKLDRTSTLTAMDNGHTRYKKALIITSTLTAMDNGHTIYKEVWFRTSTLQTIDILDIRRSG